MDINLDVSEKLLHGKSIIEWTNPSQNEVDHLHFHLYYNAFKNSNSTFLKHNNELGFLDKSLKEDCGWSYSEVNSLKDSDENELVPESYFISPDDGNPDDETVLKVPLKKIVMPGETIQVEMEWTAKIPKAMIRTGYNQDYYFFAQWFPKLGVYEPAGMRYEKEGQWSCHQYHASGEYYGEFGNYDVTLRVPKNYIVGSSGEQVSETEKNGQKVVQFKVDDVIDFTWTCSPHYQVYTENWQDVTLKLYTYPGHEIFKDRYFTTAIQSLEFMDKNVGKYPYTTLSMIDPPIHGMFTGGMEYPTLISSLSLSFLPEGIKTPETLIVHEFVHQYFMQMVATHEQEEPWMDEGITTYYEGRILDEYYGKHTSMIDAWGIEIGNRAYNRMEFWLKDNPKIADNSYKARDFVHGGYSAIAYNKTAMMLRTLEGILGIDKFDEVMKSYFDQWKFKHPCGIDFIDVFKEELDASFLAEIKFDLDQFFDQVLYGSLVCDYKVAEIVNKEKVAALGYVNNIDNCVSESDPRTGLYESKAIIYRLGEVILPVDVVLTYENGHVEQYLWDGVSRTAEFGGVSEHQLIKVQIDPERKIDLEENLINNTIMKEKSEAYRKYTSKFKVGVQHLLDFLNFLS
ncbi:hypothetical protein GCM10007940_03330 [Portibacter lacus]|uniref:Peptidase M1 membrane alanine aminopeptidase domain-containing protein n=2 Tax=Portibacter lacus TaxID=1099794 RepID=A0AA37WC34_9BACT|nr:hypothetical protein GCM10007940_03330 [Portibacter lacus]